MAAAFRMLPASCTALSATAWMLASCGPASVPPAVRASGPFTIVDHSPTVVGDLWFHIQLDPLWSELEVSKNVVFTYYPVRDPSHPTAGTATEFEFNGPQPGVYEIRMLVTEPGDWRMVFHASWSDGRPFSQGEIVIRVADVQ